MPVSSGVYTVGSGGNYTTWAAALADIAATLTGNLTFNQISDTVEPGMTGAPPQPSLAGFTLLLNSLSPHLGDPTAGHKAVCTSPPPSSYVIQIIVGGLAGSGLLEVKNLNIVADGTGSGLFVDTLGPDMKVHDIIADGTTSTGGGLSINTEPFGWPDVDVWNCECEGFGAGYSTQITNGNLKTENCTMSNGSAYGFSAGGGVNASYRNCVAFGTPADFAFTMFAAGYNNASQDSSAQDSNWSTGTGNVTGITPASEFVSLLITNPNFVRAAVGGSIEGGGIAPTIGGAGIRGNGRPGADSLYSIGADEFEPIPISSGTYTVGSGGDYSTWAAALADIAATLTGDLTLNQISDTVEPGIAAAVAPNFAGFTLTLNSLSPHVGDPTAGYKAVCAGAVGYVIYLSPGGMGGSGLLEIKNLNIQRNGAGGGLNVASLGPSVKIHDIIMLGTGGAVSGFVLTNVIGLSQEVWNCETDGFNIGFSPNESGGSGIRFENCVAANSGQYGFRPIGPGTCTIRNCVGFGSGTNDFDHPSGPVATGYNNASQDTSAQDSNWSTGTGNVTGITPANEFESLLIASPDFVKVKAGGVCEAGGITPVLTGNTQGIRGTPRPHSPAVSIGTDEFVPTTRPGLQAKQVQLDVVNFDGVLSASEKTVQQAIDVLDDKAAVASPDNQNMVALATTADQELACNTAMVHTPIGDGLVEVRVNGHTVHVGDGSFTADCYFSGDGGTNVRNMADVIAGDKLYWMGSIAGYQLITADRVSFVYEA